ncbi:MAG: sensor histidine kinase [Gemmatimonadaceae bacterium]
MATLRGRLTSAYAAALLASVVVFAAIVYAARNARAERELVDEANHRGDLAVRILRQALQAGSPQRVTPDSIMGPVLEAPLRAVLDAIPDYIVVIDAVGRLLYESPSVVSLRTPSLGAGQPRRAEDVRLFDGAVQQLRSSPEPVELDLGSDHLWLVARRDPDPVYRGLIVIAGVSRSGTAAAQRELLGTMLIVIPFVIGVSIVAAILIARRATDPIDQIINEAEAITDGRSLHRRLGITGADQEMQRLAGTLNAMLGRLETSFGGLRRFTADASHELKTPLAVLRTDVERAMSAPAGSTEQLVALEEALHETARMADLVDSLLTLARADEGRFDLHREPVDVQALADDVFETAMILGESAGLTVTMTQVDPAVVLGDYLRLRQLFLNLVTNAIKYTLRGGEVELSLVRSDSQVAFTVRDTGIGIAAAELPFIFDRFWRSDRARSRAAERGGFGLGLAICQWIAQAHGGTLTAQSRLHRGSAFTVTLPTSTVEPGSARREAYDRAAPQSDAANGTPVGTKGGAATR